MKLNLGSGSIYKDGYINIDLYADKVDLKYDLRETLPYEDNSIDEIYASHIIEHFTRQEWKKIKKDWYRVLKIGGIMEIRCPDLETCMRAFLENKEGKKWTWWILTIYGGQEDYGLGQEHKNGFTLDKLIKDLEEENFKILKAKSENEEIQIICQKFQL
jgi:predicted SAM-dependent methyltransferase